MIMVSQILIRVFNYLQAWNNFMNLSEEEQERYLDRNSRNASKEERSKSCGLSVSEDEAEQQGVYATFGKIFISAV